MKQVEGSERVVRVTVSGADAVSMERTSDSIVSEVLRCVLQDNLKEGQVPMPTSIVR